MPRGMDSENQLQINYFTKEFCGYEIESKFLVLNQSPVLTFFELYSDINDFGWDPYVVQRCMGSLRTDIRFFGLEFIFWGANINDNWEQAAMAAISPWRKDRYLLALKSNTEELNYFRPKEIPNLVIRKEIRDGRWINENEMIKKIKLANPKAEMIAKIFREKCSIYVTNKNSLRNFCLSADICYLQNNTLSQVEIEYKGRNGLWIKNHYISAKEIVNEFSTLHWIIRTRYPKMLFPDKITKFQWIINCLKGK